MSVIACLRRPEPEPEIEDVEGQAVMEFAEDG
jgi:hypothetical protein